MTEEDWERLYNNYDTTSILRAVDDIDELRGSLLGDGSNLEPPKIRNDLLKLHQLAMNVVNLGQEADLKQMATLALDLQDETDDLLETLQNVNQVINKLIGLLPESVFNSDE